MALLGMIRLIKVWPVLAIIGVVAFAYIKGQSNGEAKAQLACRQEKQIAVAQAIAQAEKTSKANLKIADTFHKKQQQAKTQIQIIEKEVIGYVDKHRNDDGCNLDTDGVRLINELINAVNGESAQD